MLVELRLAGVDELLVEKRHERRLDRARRKELLVGVIADTFTGMQVKNHESRLIAQISEICDSRIDRFRLGIPERLARPVDRREKVDLVYARCGIDGRRVELKLGFGGFDNRLDDGIARTPEFCRRIVTRIFGRRSEDTEKGPRPSPYHNDGQHESEHGGRYGKILVPVRLMSHVDPLCHAALLPATRYKKPAARQAGTENKFATIQVETTVL